MARWIDRTFSRRLAVAFLLTGAAAVIATAFFLGGYLEATLSAVLALILLGALAVASRFFSSSFSRPVENMSRFVQRLAAGEYAARISDIPADEHGRLADSINALAGQVQNAIQELSRDKAQLSAILANMTEAVVAVDAAGRV